MPIYKFDSRPEILNELDFKDQDQDGFQKFRILDIGCGEGDFINNLTSLGHETWGIEPVKKFANIAKSKVTNLISKPIEEAIIEVKDEYFDYIFFNDVIEHLVDPENILTLIKPKLKPNGLLVSSIPNVRYIDNLKNLLIKKDWEYTDSGILDESHLRFFTEKSILRMWDKLDYNVIKFLGINKMPNHKLHKFYNFMKLAGLNIDQEDILYLQFLSIVKK
jgi:2-polyprenyl-3-methyl-5-hydroxy-6-metoxy-1,4-benzoquinol methylase